MSDRHVRAILGRLYRIVEAGEKGYATAAANVSNPGLKLLLKSYAQQRSDFKNEIFSELHQPGSNNMRPGVSLPGMIHRGRVAIFAAMTIERESQERVVLKEAALGERVAVRTYERALAADLPPQIHDMLTHQLAAVREVEQRINLLRGRDGRRLVVRSCDSDKDAARSRQALIQAGFPSSAAQTIELDDEALYHGRGATVVETVLSGAFGGTLWGGLMGILAGIGVVQTVYPPPVGTAAVVSTWLFVAVGFTLIGAFISSVLALFIGFGIAEDDHYQYGKMMQRAYSLIGVITENARAAEAARILEGGGQPSAQPVLKPSIQ